MNILMKTSVLLLFAAGFYPPLLAQKKLALANECFDAKAYYLASRYYQEFFEKNTDHCHSDRIKLAQSLSATQELGSAKVVFETYMNCQRRSPADYIVYGKFLIDIKAYEQAIPYFEQAMIAEPQLARHYLLVCQTALPKGSKSSSTIFTNQVIPQQNDAQLEDHKVKLVETISSPINTPTPTLTASALLEKPQVNLTTGISVYEVSNPKIEINPSNRLAKPMVMNLRPERSTMTEKESVQIIVEKKFSPYGVRLGTYMTSTIPDLRSVENYGRIEQKKWKGKIIVFLVDFPNRIEAEATVELARQANFRSAVLVEKLSSGRMKSVQ